MSKPVDWRSIAKPLDVTQIQRSKHHLRCWHSYGRTEVGVAFNCETARGDAVHFQVDVIAPDVIRVRMALAVCVQADRPSELLMQNAWPPMAFEIAEAGDCLILTTGRLRLEFQRLPWQMRAYAADEPGQPFFAERIDDRAYGPGYEVSPVGFEPGPDGRQAVREAVAVTPGEAFYGFGEKFTPLDKWGQELISWAVDCGNVSSGRSYKNVPFFLSSAGYGIFVHATCPIVYRMGSESSISYSFHVAEERLDYFLLYGPDQAHILRRYWDLTGPAPVPPKWSFGFWLSRAGYRSRGEVEAVVREMRARDFPLDVISLDPWWMGESPWCSYRWDLAAFPDPAGMMAALRAAGVRTCLWITPYVPQGTDLYQEGVVKGYLVSRPPSATQVKDASDHVSEVQEAFSGSTLGAVDFTNPAATTWFQSKLAALLESGVAVFKSDFGEQAPLDALYHDGRRGLEMHNLYPLLYNRAVFEITERTFGRGLTWGRSGYAGSQRYPVQWGGDSYSSLDQMAGQLRGLLSYGLSGVPFCSHDVGGFDFAPAYFDQAPDVDLHQSYATNGQAQYPKDPVVYIRWLQFGTFSSHMRAHGKQPHEPWTYGPEAETISRRYLRLRYRLLPYIYSEAVEACRTALPMVRPMMLAHPADPNARNLDLQYMFGDSFLVAPVFRHDGRVQVYLPAGDWVDYWTKEIVPGGRWLDMIAPLDTLPLWVRAGAIVPLGPEQDYVDQRPLDPLTVELYAPGAHGSFAIHDEDKSDVRVSYRWSADGLTVISDPTPGAVEFVWYGVHARSAQVNGTDIPIEVDANGQRVRFDGRQGATLILVI